ncbi:MAG: flagellar hook-associated protein FlgK [Roseburia sp.]|nr:flagellar hook-associated protein FlgK [Roseburia sp.]
MANTMGSLFIGASGIKVSQNALNITANNLANVDTKGYVRQQVLQGDRDYYTFDTTASISHQQSGLGVTIADAVHARDIFLDKTYRSQTSRHGFYSSTYEAINEVETLFQELEGKAFQELLVGEDDGLYAAFEEFAKNPSASENQNLVIQKANLFVSKSQAIYQGLEKYQDNMNTQIHDMVERINEIGESIHELNNYIMAIESGNVETAMNLRDARDYLVDELAQYGAVSYKEVQNGIVKVTFENVLFVDEAHAYHMGEKVDKVTGFITPYWDHLSNTENDKYYKVINPSEEISMALKSDTGELKGLVLARGYKRADYRDLEGISTKKYDETLGNSVMMNIQSEFDELVHSLVTQINDVFCPNIGAANAITGVDENGNRITINRGDLILDTENCRVGANGNLPPQELFERVGCSRYSVITGDDGNTYYLYNQEDQKDISKMYTISSIQINPELKRSDVELPAFEQGLIEGEYKVAYGLGDELTAIWSRENLILTPHDTTPCTIAEYYNKMTGELATLGNVFNDTAKGLEQSKLETDNARQQVIGVSSDEELTNMIKFQNAYNAASRYINVVDEMIETIIRQMG